MSEEVVSEAPQEVPVEEKPIDPRAVAVKDSIVNLLDSAQGIWRDAMASQVRLTKAADILQQHMNEIKEYSALPIYPGMKTLQNSINRIQNCKKRIGTVGTRLNRISGILQQQRMQKERIQAMEKQRLAEEEARRREMAPVQPAPVEEPKETVTAEEPKEEEIVQETPNTENAVQEEAAPVEENVTPE